MQLRKCQHEAKNAVKESFKSGIDSQLVVMPTGTGKRFLSINIGRHFKRNLFIAHREELIEQAYYDYEKLNPFTTGVIKGKLFEIGKKNVIGSVQTLYNRLGKIPPDTFDHVIVDEAHMFRAKTYNETVRHFKPKLLIGYTATPKRHDGLSLANLFEEITYQYQLDEAINDEYLAKPDAYQIKTIVDLSKVGRVAGDFNQKQLSDKVDNELRNELVVQKYKQYCPKGEQFLCYAVDIQHAVHLKEQFEKHNIHTEVVVSDESITPDRRGTIEKFKSKKIQGLINVEILTVGFDYNDVGCLLMARPTQSETLYIQITGRGLRLKSKAFQEKFGHNRCKVLDFVDNTGKHNLINCYELDKGKPIEKRIFLPDEYKEKLLKTRRDIKIKHHLEKDKKIDLLKLPEVHVWDSIKMLEPATEAQLKWMKNIGVYEEGIEYTKKQASEFISNSKAAYWQIKKLIDLGYDVSTGVTIGQYQAAINGYNKKHKFSRKSV